ncbi:rho GTPase-activating protein 22-like [Platysternon megacephalum]|uniref:Mitochondrial fission factor n=1 Tax=Platysternon megacephalum TaxID=55544 RepID=A0A4D9E8E0_9SAUR|nr:rho GTPase-activating protein 22-like [Platysternon megacephalum]
MMMWPFRGLEMNRAPCDLSFMEAINQRMQVPNRLKVADESNPLDEERKAEELRPSFRMHIPDRLSLAEMRDDSRRPLLLDQLRQHPSIVVHTLQDPSTQPAGFGELLFLDTSAQSGTQKRKRSTHHGRLRKERTPSETPQIALRSTSRKPDRPGISPRPSPPFSQDARIYSPQNIFQMVYFLGHLLFHRVKKSARDRAQPSSQDAGPASESSLEEIGVTDIIAMRKQLNKISGRLRTLEEQCTGWRQKELLVYSVLVSACLMNTWLWLRR